MSCCRLGVGGRKGRRTEVGGWVGGLSLTLSSGRSFARTCPTNSIHWRRTWVEREGGRVNWVADQKILSMSFCISALSRLSFSSRLLVGGWVGG